MSTDSVAPTAQVETSVEAEQPKTAPKKTAPKAKPKTAPKPKATAKPKDEQALALANAAGKMADKAGLRSRYLIGEGLQFRANYTVAKDRGSVVVRRKDGVEGKVSLKALRSYALARESVEEAVAFVRALGVGPKLTGRKFGLYCLADAARK